MKLFTLLICTLFLSNCGSSKDASGKSALVEKIPFIITVASSQQWVAGVQGGGSGTNVSIQVENLPEDIVFNEIHYNGLVSEVTLTNEGSKTMLIGAFNNALNKDVIMDSDPLKEAQNTIQKKSPYTLGANEAMLVFTTNEKVQHYKITAMEEKPLLAYPSANPNQDGMGIGN